MYVLLKAGMVRLHPCIAGTRQGAKQKREMVSLFCSLSLPWNSGGGLRWGHKAMEESEYRFWLENAVRWHRFTEAETALALGIPVEKVSADVVRFQIPAPGDMPAPGEAVCVLPYPRGRHPRIGFLDGAVHPRRDTKVSVFPPWDATGYVVVDVPEAIWHHDPIRQRDTLLFLAHEHSGFTPEWAIHTPLPLRDWERHPSGTLSGGLTLPIGVTFAMSVTPSPGEVSMTLSLTNHTEQTLTGLRLQNCVMLKGLPGFTEQTETNKVFKGSIAACRSEETHHVVLTSWERCVRAWGNPACPCIHADPQFPNCPPGATVHLHGWLAFYEGNNLDTELEQRLQTG